MRGYGEGRVITALFRLPRINAKNIIYSLPYVLNDEAERKFAIEYIADSINLFAKMIANGDGGCFDKTLSDILRPKKEDTRSAREIADDVIARLGLTENKNV